MNKITGEQLDTYNKLHNIILEFKNDDKKTKKKIIKKTMNYLFVINPINDQIPFEVDYITRGEFLTGEEFNITKLSLKQKDNNNINIYEIKLEAKTYDNYYKYNLDIKISEFFIKIRRAEVNLNLSI